MPRHYTVEEEKALERAVRAGTTPTCPRCHVALHTTSVHPSSQVAYVRDRVILQCPSCQIRAVVDRK